MKLIKEQATIIKQLSREGKLSESEIASFLVEMGIGYIIAVRKGKEESAIDEMNEQILNNPDLTRIAQRLEVFWDAGMN